jgi:tetratricopeptide (TPR) repeat protein
MYFVVLLIPLFPLGKKRVLNECPVCKKHHRLSLSKWEQEKGKAVPEAVSNYERRSNEEQAALEALAVVASYQDKAAFLKLVSEIVERHGHNAGLLKLVGGMYSDLGYLEEADEVLCRSLEVQADREVYEMLAVVLMRGLEPDEAARYLQHIIDEKISEKTGYLILLAEAYQAVGEHAKALEVLDRAAEIRGALSTDKRYKKLLKLSQRNLHRGKRITQKHLQPARQLERERDWMGGLAGAVWPVVVAILLAAYTIVSHRTAASQAVYFVSGLSKPYKITVNGASYTLRPANAVRIETGEGPVFVEVVEGGPNIPGQTYEVRTSFWLRPFLNKTFVINPDGVAAILWEKVYYAVEGRDRPDGESELYVGKSFYVFDRLDYVFRPFPESVKLDGEGTKLAKKRVCLAAEYGLTVDAILPVLGDEQGGKAAVDFLKKHVLYEPESPVYLQLLFEMVEHEEFIKTVRVGLAVRPVRIDWHRYYQEAVEKAEPEYDLAGEYRTYLQADPENAALQYLMGRSLRRPEEAATFYHKSVSGEAPCPYGFVGLAFQKMTVGRFDEALELAGKAIALGPENSIFYQQYRSALEATGRYDELIEEYRKEQSKAPTDLAWIAAEIDIWLAKDQRGKAEERFNEWAQEAGLTNSPGLLEEIKEAIGVRIAYLSGDLAEYEQLMSGSSDPGQRIAVDLSLGRTADEKVVEQLQSEDPYLYGALYLAEQRRGRAQRADEFLAKAVGLLREQGWEETVMADCLAGHKQAVVPELCSLPLEPRSKAILLTAMGVKYPEHKERYFELARRLNYNRGFPHLLLKSVLGETASGD